MSERKPLGVLSDEQAQQVLEEVCSRLCRATGCQVLSVFRSEIRGKGGNVEFLLALAP